jgi:hypothetical protein
MEFTKTTVSEYRKKITANYNYVKGERHISGIEVPSFSDHISIHRSHSFCAWRGTGTGGSFHTSIITETFRQEGRTDKIAMVNLQVDVDFETVSIAMNSGEARRLAEVLLYKADEADKIEKKQ